MRVRVRFRRKKLLRPHFSNGENMTRLRHWFSITLVASVVTALSVDAAAQSYPTKPVRIIVPFSPGGASDALPRLLGAKLSELWGQQIIIDNRPGAAGNIG